tara:strand:+ start:125 stop:757 length:633 start_codon:yes stop_codon:yes gene_type:complete
MTRLTKLLKENIIESALEQSGVNKEISSLRKRRADLAENVRIDSLGGSETIKKIESEFKKLTKIDESKILKGVSRYTSNRLIERGYIDYVNFGGMQAHLYFSGASSDHENRIIGSVKKSPLPNDCVYVAGHKFTEEFINIENESKIAKERKNGLKLQLLATLDQFTTVKKLLTSWPESKDLLPKNIDEIKPKLPVVLVKDLNCLIGLPKD